MKRKAGLFFLVAIFPLFIKGNEIPDKLFQCNLTEYNPSYIAFGEKLNLVISGSQFLKDETNYYFSRGRIDLGIPFKRKNSGIDLHTSIIKNQYYDLYDAGIAYGKKFSFSQNIALSYGVCLSFQNYTFKQQQTYFDNRSFDRYYWGNLPELKLLDHLNVDAGLWLKVYDFQLGLSTRNITKQHVELLDWSDTSLYRITRKFDCILTHEIEIELVNLGKIQNSLIILDLNHYSENKRFIFSTLVTHRNTFLIGLSINYLRTKYGYTEPSFYFSPIIGINLNNKFKFLVSLIGYRRDSYKNKENTIEGILTYTY